MILMVINGFCNLFKGDVVLNKRSWHRCGKAEVESKSLGTGPWAIIRLGLNQAKGPVSEAHLYKHYLNHFMFHFMSCCRLSSLLFFLDHLN